MRMCTYGSKSFLLCNGINTLYTERYTRSAFLYRYMLTYSIQPSLKKMDLEGCDIWCNTGRVKARGSFMSCVRLAGHFSGVLHR
jgi:hypothetical protein